MTAMTSGDLQGYHRALQIQEALEALRQKPSITDIEGHNGKSPVTRMASAKPTEGGVQQAQFGRPKARGGEIAEAMHTAILRSRAGGTEGDWTLASVQLEEILEIWKPSWPALATVYALTGGELNICIEGSRDSIVLMAGIEEYPQYYLENAGGQARESRLECSWDSYGKTVPPDLVAALNRVGQEERE